MKIAINLLHYIPGKLGGLETYANNLLGDLRTLANESTVQLFIITSEQYKESLSWCEEFAKIISLKVNVDNSAKRIFSEQFLLGKIIKENEIDILHSSGYTAPVLPKCKKVVTLHDINYIKIPKTIRKSHGLLRWIIIRLLGPMSLKFSDKIIVVSDYIKRELRSSFNISNDKIEVIPNRAPVDIFKTEKTPIDLPEAFLSRYLLYVASWYPHKNHEIIFKAFERIQESENKLYPLVLAGLHFKSEDQKKEFKSRIHAIRNHVYVVDRYLSSSELAWLYSNSKLFLFPSLYEGFGIPILEAMSAGKPVISSNLQPMIDIGGNAIIKFDPNNEEDLIGKINEMYNSHNLYQKYSELSRKRYLELSDRSITQEIKLKEIYLNLYRKEQK